MKRIRGGSASVTLAAGMALIVGCQHSPEQALGPFGGSGDPVAELTPEQVTEVQVALAKTLEARGEADMAISAYSKFLEEHPDRTDVCVRLAGLCERNGRFEEADQLYRRAVSARPDDANLFCNWGYGLYLRHDWARAEAAFRKSLSLEPGHKRAHNNLGLVLARTQRDREALAEFQLAGCSEGDAISNLRYARRLNGGVVSATHQASVGSEQGSAPAVVPAAMKDQPVVPGRGQSRHLEQSSLNLPSLPDPATEPIAIATSDSVSWRRSR